MSRRQLVALAILVLAGPLATEATACTCLPRTMPEYLEEADAAFVGTVCSRWYPNENAAIQSSADPVYFTFRVEMAWKGVEADTVTIRTASGGSSCGTNFAAGVRHVVFARSREGELRTGMCSGNRVLESSLAARFLLPQPAAVIEGATWPGLGGADLVDRLAAEDERARGQAASLLSLPYDRKGSGRRLQALVLAFPAESAALFSSLDDSVATARGLRDLATDALSSPNTLTRRAGFRALGALTHGDELAGILQIGFSNPEDSDGFSTAGWIMVDRYRDLSRARADELVQKYIAGLDPVQSEAGWVLVQWLGLFPDQSEFSLPYLEGLIASEPGGKVEDVAREVRKALLER